MRLAARRTAVVKFFLLLAVLPAGAAAASPDGPLRVAEPTSLGEAVVGFQPGSLPSVTTTLAGLPVRRVSTGGAFVVVQAGDLRAVRAAVAALPGVRFVEDNVVKHSLVTPNDTRYGEQYGPNLMGFPAAWGQAGYGTSSVKVAVLDTGLLRTHQDFTPASRFLAGYDYVNDDPTPEDGCGHGTHTTGTVAASTNNGVGVAGMSQATILPLKVLELVGGILDVTCTGSAADIAQAIRDAADQGAKVISMSLGGGDSTVEREAVTYASNKGSLIVAAAGNDGANNSIDFPAAYPESIAVAAVTNTKARASYSDGGPQLDISAPGSNVLSTYKGANNATYSSLSGTSMATPHVAGALALALSCAPTGTTTAQVRNALYATAEDLGTAGRDDSFGYGLARADRLVAQICTGAPQPGNNAPTARFTSSTTGLTVSVNGTTSNDPDCDPLTYSWAFGDGGTASGATASRTYAAAGTYTVTLTVNDGRGGVHNTSAPVTVASGGDPDPSTPNLTSGQQISVTMTGAGTERFYKIAVPAGKSQLQVVMTGPACGLLGCSFDTDLYTRFAARPTAMVYACRPYAGGSNETCTHASPAAGYWYVRLYDYAGSGTVTLKATVT